MALSLTLLGTLACESTGPEGPKPNVPDDHTVEEHGVFHKSGHERPFDDRSTCSSSFCHHADLEGGWSLAVTGTGVLEQSYAPSCYQCHGVEWDDTRPQDVRVLYPTTDVVWRHGDERHVEYWARGASRATVNLLQGGVVAAVLADNELLDETLRVPVDPAWGVGGGYQIEVTDNRGQSNIGESFTVCAEAAVVVSRPSAGTSITVGELLAVEWDCASGASVNITVWRNNEFVDVFRDGAGNTEFIERTVPATWGSGDGFRIRIIDFEGTVGMSEPFTIVAG